MLESTFIDSLRKELATESRNANSQWAALRLQALERFENLGWPKAKDELWKYTSPQTFLAAAQPLRKEANFASSVKEELSQKERDCYHLRIVDGHIDEDRLESLSDSGLKISLGPAASPKFRRHVEELLRYGDGFQMLGFAAQTSAMFIEAPAKKTEIDRPLLIDFIVQGSSSRPSMVVPVVCIDVAEGAALKIIERYTAVAEGVWQQPLLSYWQEKNSHLRVARLVRLHDRAQFLGYSSLLQESFAQAELLTMVSSGQLVRSLNHVHQRGQNSFCRSHGLALLKPGAHCDLRSFFSHDEPFTSAEQVFKSVVSEKGRFVFNGKIYIGEGAQKTDSSMLNKNLLLGSMAEADCKPELEVYADDVKASHGASVGQLDLSELFYLMSRGLSKDKSLELLARGYIEDVVLNFSSADVRDFVFAQMAEDLKDMIHRIEGH